MGVKRRGKKAAKQKGGLFGVGGWMWGWKIRDKIKQLGGGVGKKKNVNVVFVRKLFFARKCKKKRIV